jgi:predicted homoserine dehydrogenase-like protein
MGRRGGMARGASRRRRTTRRRRRRRRRRIILIGGLVALGAWKLSKRDVDRVEEHTGKSADDLSDKELEQAMEDLNIEKQPMDEKDQAYVASEEQATEEGKTSYIDDIERLSKLKDQGIITEEEFQTKKQQLLDM